jgi:hypothetical protein
MTDVKAYVSVVHVWLHYISVSIDLMWGHAVARLVEALRYKPEGRVFDFQWCH